MKKLLFFSTNTPIFLRLFIKIFRFTLVYILFEFWCILLAIVELVPIGVFGIEFSLKIIHSWPIIFAFFYFIFAQMILAALFSLIISSITFFISYLFSFTEKNTFRSGVGLCALGLINVLLLNYYFFPWSLFAIFRTHPLSFIIVKWSLLFLNGLFLVLITLALIGLIKWIIKEFTPFYYLVTGIALMVILSSVAFIYLAPLPLPQQSSKPNIIIIGIDSLRPDYTGLNNNKISSLTPNIDRVLKDATIFSNNYTPLARTSAAWVAILTGDDPKITGIRHNLFDPNDVSLKYTLAHILEKQGYFTVYATDDRRFNPVTEAYGFDKLIAPAPKPGFNDFFLGSFNEKPLSNLIINTRLGAWLFPYSYANRSVGATYQTQTFVNFLKDSLVHLPKRPMFLGIHLTLVHWPLYWADAPIAFSRLPNTQGQDVFTHVLFREAVHTVDHQFGEVINVLQQNHLLDNTLLIVMSDHGESLGTPADRVDSATGYHPYKKHLNNAIFQLLTEPVYGHGTDVLSMTQYHSVLAMKIFGHSYPQFKTKQIAMPTSLIDITPTVLNLLHLPSYSMQGTSLLPYLMGDAPDLDRYLFIETGVTLEALKTANPNIENLLDQGMKYFTINPENATLIYKPSVETLILRGKQRAVIHYPWLLAIYPINPTQTVLVIANMQTHQWSTELDSPLGREAQASVLFQKLYDFYGRQEILAHI